MLKNIFGGSTKGKSGVGAKSFLTKEEAAEILNPTVAQSAAMKLGKPDYINLSVKDPQVWHERARYVISTLVKTPGKQKTLIIDYGVYALDQFILCSSDKNSKIVINANNVIEALVKEWRTWKPVEQAAIIEIDFSTLVLLSIRYCTWLFQLEGYQDVVEFYDEYLEGLSMDESQSAQAKMLKVRSLVALGKSGEATKFCRKIYTHPPYHPFYCLMIGNILFAELSCFEDAIECYNTITDKIEKTSDNAETIAKAWHNKALAYFQLKQLDKGKTAVSQCVAIAPHNCEPYKNAQYILDVMNGRVKPPSNAGMKIMY